MKNNQKGFAHIGLILVAVVVLGAIGFVGYTIATKDKENSSKTDQPSSALVKKEKTDSQKPVATAAPIEDPTKDWTLVTPKNTGSTFTVKVPKSLLPNGTCRTKEVLLALTYNSGTVDYDCSGVKDATQYASIVFGVSSQSIVATIGAAQSSQKLTLADGKTAATKNVVSVSEKGNGGTYTARYVIYEATSKTTGANYYAVYKTGVGFSDENKFLNDFEAAATKGWTLP